MRFFTLALAALATSVVALPTSELRSTTDLVTRHFLDGSHSSFNLFGGLDAEGCAAFAGACLGAKASSISASAKASLEAWIGTAELDVDVKASLKSWCSGSDELDVDVIAELAFYLPVAVSLAAEGGLSVAISGITSVVADLGVALDAFLQADVTAFLKLNADIDSEIKVALQVCAEGGVVAALAADVKIALAAYLKSSKCGLSADLKVAIGLWLEGKTGSGVSIIGKASGAASVSASVGVSIAAAVDVEGIVSATFITALKTWIAVEAGLEADVKAALELCIAGKAAIELEEEVVIKLTAWLVSDKCGLAAQLKAVVFVWLYVRATVGEAVSVLSAADIATLTAWFEGEVSASLSAVVRGVIAAAIAGEAVINVSLDAVSELVAVVAGLVSDISVSVDIVIILGKWVSGNTCGCP
ncbi:hypothetical protein BGW36DRAFT_300941 [Talaromyces proteolyticus]|uniref:Cell wall protein n=1 Tax=Talaromyces proteolyticus TaxID=1131652 RepID=A0AAD4KL69_9EURO|nr:uncharacterized protein BGW36DRAFT_300941 [Talaromyces proteolyticus]KAH8694107.1 hypothetical protein BGW36DRAFT_300941 [Talaromyces proteolyticus]